MQPSDLHISDGAGVSPEHAHGGLDVVVPRPQQGAVVGAAHHCKWADFMGSQEGTQRSTIMIAFEREVSRSGERKSNHGALQMPKQK